MQIIKVAIPEYNVDYEPDAKKIGKLLDNELKKHFMGKDILVRSIGSSEHQGKSVDELIDIIQRTGTDRYDPSRKGDRYENVQGERIDLFAFRATVSDATELCWQVIYGFYHSALGIHGRAVQIDLLIIYDANQMQQIPHSYEGRTDIKDDGYVFINPNNKTEALLGFVKIDS